MRPGLFCLLALLFAAPAAAQTVEGHFRSRPPEMVIADDGGMSGPIKDVIEAACRSVGLTIHWQVVPFARSLEALRNGEPVLVPRLRPEPERTAYIRYLGPLAIQHRLVRIAARPATAATIRTYEDLKPLRVATLRGSATFAAFDEDGSIDKQTMTDDDGRARLLAGGRVDAIISSDPSTLVPAFAEIGFSDWAWAPYQVTIDVGNYYGIAETGPLAGLGDALDKALRHLTESGEVARIYQEYNLDPEAFSEGRSPS
jgi:ABC-type amino acid transport substrate-binding protein